MDDLRSSRQKFLAIAAECDLIANLATEAKKRETFAGLANDLKRLADDLYVEIERREVELKTTWN